MKTLRWQVHPGNNQFFCNGRLVSSKQKENLYFTVTLLSFSIGLFCTFELEYVYRTWGLGALIVSALVVLMCIANFFMTAFSDPGILPRLSKNEEQSVERMISATGIYSASTKKMIPPPTMVKVAGETTLLKFCHTCRIYRPYKASHCSLCNNCVERFDHHCPWLGTCIGQRNYRSFMTFLTFLSLLIVIASTVSTYRIVQHDGYDSVGQFLKSKWYTLILSVVSGLMSIPVIGLVAYHYYLICVGANTHSDMKTILESDVDFIPMYLKVNITPKVCALSCFEVFCTNPKDGIDFTAVVDNQETEKRQN